MKRLLILTALLPFVGFAQPINTLNNPNQPGERNPARQQMLPNTNGGMLNSNRNPDSSLNQQHMLPERRNGDMLNQPSTPQPDIPLKTIGP
ncbi:TPA: DUF2756 domain-containing protein [Escherichia coli]|nr:DUF2756 domain-containing protein [Escherichia coli]HAH3314614.1 DUF2756 domain-containing protein [Escherichia coli]